MYKTFSLFIFFH